MQEKEFHFNSQAHAALHAALSATVAAWLDAVWKIWIVAAAAAAHVGKLFLRFLWNLQKYCMFAIRINRRLIEIGSLAANRCTT